MLEMGTSGLMSGAGKRGGATASALAPGLDSTFWGQVHDSNIYVRSKRAGERVMESVMRFIATKLKLRVNQQKSMVARPWERSFSVLASRTQACQSGG